MSPLPPSATLWLCPACGATKPQDPDPRACNEVCDNHPGQVVPMLAPLMPLSAGSAALDPLTREQVPATLDQANHIIRQLRHQLKQANQQRHWYRDEARTCCLCGGDADVSAMCNRCHEEEYVDKDGA